MGAFWRLSAGDGVEKVHEITRITRWFLYGFERLAQMERSIVDRGVSPTELNLEELRLWKSHGFSDAHIADALAGFPPEGLKSLLMVKTSGCRSGHQLKLHPVYRMVDSCAAEFRQKHRITTPPTNLMSTGIDRLPNMEERTKERLVAIGSGPIALDRALNSITAAFTPSKPFGAGKDAILINNNPETSDRL